MEISILHLSDLHITNRNGIYSDVHKNLLQDIKKQCQYLNHIIIVITGDVIDKANYDETFEVAKKFFQEILKKHPPKKTLSHFKQVKGLIPNHERECVN